MKVLKLVINNRGEIEYCWLLYIFIYFMFTKAAFVWSEMQQNLKYFEIL